MSPRTGPASITSEVAYEIQQRTDALMRRRFTHFAIATLALSCVFFVFQMLWSISARAPAGSAGEGPAVGAVVGQGDAAGPAVTQAPRRAPRARADTTWRLWVYLIGSYAGAGAALMIILHRRPRLGPLIALSIALVIFEGLLLAALWYSLPFFFAFTHILAASMLPWSARHAAVPIPAVAVAYGASSASGGAEPIVWVTLAVGVCAVSVPGVLVAVFREQGRLRAWKLEILEARYGSIRQELSAARRIHEMLFPAPERRGAISFDYRYQPMRLIGGDYLFTRFHPCPKGTSDCALSLIVLDVTGHGVSAALTVNRLYGEVQRLFSEREDLAPGEALRALNHYVSLTLAQQALFVTAVCARVDPAQQRLRYASGGHPPALLRTAQGHVVDLPVTAHVLGALSDAEFDPDERSERFAPGDTLCAYTDGVLEARDPQGRMLGLEGIRAALAGLPGQPALSERLIEVAAAFRMAPPIDDTLAVEVRFEAGPREAPATDTARDLRAPQRTPHAPRAARA